ncbi:MAG TPA: SRPBCC family protein [Anaerolineae bacterium]|nr:SRPBCC family protein [Anaerolineae bacterium]
MKTQQVSASAIINAPARQIYTILADYHGGHPRILPRQYFSALEVKQGGVGAGTALRFQMRASGTTRTFLADVTEPEPGRVLVESNRLESDPTSTSVTTFTVDPINGDQQARVTISTALSISNWLEGLFTTMFLRRVYAQELKQIVALAAERQASSSAESVHA